MDRKVWRKLFNLGLYLFIGAHLTMLTVYVLPHEPASNAVTGISDLYMSKFFHQEWDLFAPESPQNSYRLMAITIDDSGDPLDTINPIDDSEIRHLNGSSFSSTKEVYMNRRIARNLAASFSSDKKELMEYREFILLSAKHYLREYASGSDFKLFVTVNDEPFVRMAEINEMEAEK